MKISAQKVMMIGLVGALTGVSGMLMGCAKSAASSDSTSGAVEDSSASGIAAGAAGGALSSSTSAGTMAGMKFVPRSDLYASIRSALNPLPQAIADSLCPTFQTTTGVCSTSGSSMWLDYSGCTFQGRISWSAIQEIKMSSGTAACGTFPNPGANGTLYREFVTAQNSTTPGSATLVSSVRTLTVDDATANLGNFDGDTIGFNTNGTYGSAVSFDSTGHRSQLVVDHHISVTGAYDHSVTGTLQLSETADGSSRIINGPMTVYHNLLRVVGTSTFTNVEHDNTCCLPVSGEIQTTFSRGSNVDPTAAGLAMVGKTETLNFTGCGTGTLQGTDGTVTNVTLDRCF